MSKRKQILYVSLSVVLPFSSGQVANGQTTTLTFQEGVDDYPGCGDTYLPSSSCPPSAPPPVFVDRVIIDCCDANPACEDPTVSCPDHGLLRFGGIFGNDPNQIPFGSDITSASLWLNVSSGHGGSITTTVHRMLQEWTEDDTWCQWGNGIQPDDEEAVSTPDDTILPVSPGTLLVTVTPSLQAWSAGATNYGWALLPGDESNDGWAFSSCEHGTLSSRPMLQVMFEPVAVPTVSEWGLIVMTLLLLTVGKLVYTRRRAEEG